MPGRSRSWLAFASALLLGCGRAEPAPPTVSAAVTFRCLWWSQEQMESINPNAPPPKTTEVTLHAWEYTDPIGVPHPDTVDVVVELSADGGEPISGVVATVEAAWLIGAPSSAESARWGDASRVLTSTPTLLSPGTKTTIRVPVPIAARMAELDGTGEWPWALRVIVNVRAEGRAEPLVRAQAELPIRPGD